MYKRFRRSEVIRAIFFTFAMVLAACMPKAGELSSGNTEGKTQSDDLVADTTAVIESVSVGTMENTPGSFNPPTGQEMKDSSGDFSSENAKGGFMPAGSSEEFADWWGVIKSITPEAQYDDYFERLDMGSPIYFGIDSLAPAIQAQIAALRDSGKIVHLFGTLFSNVLDYNHSQVQVDRIEVEE